MVVLLVILTVLCFITVELTIRWKEKRRVEASLGVLDPATLLPYRPAHEMPGGLFFHGGHTWAKIENSGNVQVGLDGFAQGVLGRVDRYELPAKGKRVRQGEPALAVHQSGKRIEFVAPVDGEICAVNERLNADLRAPETRMKRVARDPSDKPGPQPGPDQRRLPRLEKEVRDSWSSDSHQAVPQGSASRCRTAGSTPGGHGDHDARSAVTVGSFH